MLSGHISQPRAVWQHCVVALRVEYSEVVTILRKVPTIPRRTERTIGKHGFVFL